VRLFGNADCELQLTRSPLKAFGILSTANVASAGLIAPLFPASGVGIER
jgi:hypothetical protein